MALSMQIQSLISSTLLRSKALPTASRPFSSSTSAFPRRTRLSIIARPKPITKVLNPPRSSSLRCYSAITPELKTTLDKVVTSHKVIVFMKGTKDFPQCGFSSTVVQILKSLNVPFETVNILENEMLRQGLKDYSNWPTFPQVYIDGEFYGGCDITVDAYKNGELQEAIEKAICS